MLDLTARLRKLRWPPYWTDVRSISNTGAARLVILIPVIGYWIILNDRLLVLSKLSEVVVTPSSPPTVSWRLLATYFGLCFIAIASGVYQWRCPREVKEHGSPTDYISKVASHMSDIEERRVRERVHGDDRSLTELGKIKGALNYPQPKNDKDVVWRAKESGPTFFRRTSTLVTGVIQYRVPLLVSVTSSGVRSYWCRRRIFS